MDWDGPSGCPGRLTAASGIGAIDADGLGTWPGVLRKVSNSGWFEISSRCSACVAVKEDMWCPSRRAVAIIKEGHEWGGFEKLFRMTGK